MPTDTLSLAGEVETDGVGGAEEDAPKGMERRLVLRLLTHWRELVGEGEYPSFSQLEPELIPDIWDYSFVLDICGHLADPVFRVAGPKFAAYSSVDFRNLRVSQAPRDSLIEKAVEFVQEVIAKQVPISRGGEFFKSDGVKVFYRGIMLPTSDDGITVTGLLGAANCREESV